MTDRDQVAREVLTEAIEHMAGRDAVVAAHELTKLRDERYPAPAAPVTVKVLNEWTLQRRGYFQDRGGNCTPYGDEWTTALHRIASDARRIAELERERGNFEQLAREFSDNTEYYRRLVVQIGETLGPDAYVSDDGSVQQDVLCAKVPELVAAMKRERDEARRQLETAKEWLRVAQAATSQGEGIGAAGGLTTAVQRPHASNSDDGAASTEQSPAPIPLGAVVEVEHNGRTVTLQMDPDTQEWVGMKTRKQQSSAWEDSLATALYRALHPVADAATVERVALRVKQYNGPTAVSAEGFARIILEELGYTIQEGA